MPATHSIPAMFVKLHHYGTQKSPLRWIICFCPSTSQNNAKVGCMK